jgi:phospholipid/cholesterol/gamma-HCH transport system substrate-binding protein
METRANYILIGLFTLVVLAAGFGFVYWFSHTGTGSERATYRVLFEGSVAGLRPGASVLFNGIRVGEVIDLRLDPENPKEVAAVVGIEKTVPVRADTRVGLDFQGLTGIASVTLKGGSPTAPLIAAKDGEIPTIVADPSATKDVTQAIRDVATNAGSVLQRVDALVAENDASLKSIVQNIKSFSGSLVENEASLKEIVANIKGFTATLNNNSERLERIFAGMENLTGETTKDEIIATVRSVRTLAENLEKHVDEISAGLTRFSTRGLREWEQLAIDGRRAVATLDQAIKNFDRNPSRLIFGGSADPAPTGSVDAPRGRRPSPPQ